MDGLVADKPKGRFISIKATDGKFHEKVPEGTEGSEVVEYELKDGTKGKKSVIKYPRIENVFITNVEFEDGDYGKNVLVTLSDGENEIVWAQGTKTPFGEDLMKKLPAVDFAEKLTIQPYSFPSEKTGKPVRGVNIYQTSDKVLSHFWDGEKAINGIPEYDKVDAKSFDSDDWASHFTTVRKFLVNYIEEHVRPKFAGRVEDRVEVQLTHPDKMRPIGEIGLYADTDDIKPSDIPF